MVVLNKIQKELIENNAIAFATVDKNKKPHNIYVGYVKVLDKNKLIISQIYIFNTIKNIGKNPNVSLCVCSRDWEKKCIGYEFKGKAKYYSKGKYFDFVKNLPENKDEKVKGAIVIKINQVKRLS